MKGAYFSQSLLQFKTNIRTLTDIDCLRKCCKNIKFWLVGLVFTYVL